MPTGSPGDCVHGPDAKRLVVARSGPLPWSGMWRIVVALVVLFLVVSILGLALRALRWLLGVAIVIAIIAAVLGALGRSRDR